MDGPALHLAASGGFEQIAKFLIEQGANVNLQDKVFFDFNFSYFFICCCGSLLGCFMLIVNGCCVM